VNRRNSLSLDIALGTGGPADSLRSRRALQLEGLNVAKGMTAVCALIDGPSSLVDQVYDTLVESFANGSSADGLARAQQASYIAKTLAPFVRGRQPVPVVALAVSIGGEVLLSCIGGGRAYVRRDADLEDFRRLARDAGDRRECPVVRVPLYPDDGLVLTTDVVALNLSEQELRHTVVPSANFFPLQEQATWLATVAGSRSGEAAGALVLRCSPGSSVMSGAVARTSSRQAAGLLGGFAFVAVLVGLGVILGGYLFKSSSHAAGVVEMPRGLTTLRAQPTEVLVAWHPVAAATSYLVKLDGQQYRSPASRLAFHGILQPGKRYHWRVQAAFANHLGPLSAPSSLRVPPLPIFPSIEPLSPPPFYLTGKDRGVPFCWRTRLPAARADLYVSGPSSALHRAVKQPSARRYGGRTQCSWQYLQRDGTYAWRVGATAGGYVETWVPWRYVWVGSRVVHTRPHAHKSGHARTVVAAPSHVTYRPPPAAAPLPVAQPPAAQPPAATYAQSAPAPVYQPPAARPVYRAPAPVYQPPAPVPVYHPPTAPNPQPTPQPAPPQVAPQPHEAPPPQPAAQPAPRPAPQPAPTQPVVACPNPPNCT